MIMPESPSQHELVGAARQGDERAIRALVVALNPRLFRVVRAILDNDADAQDALQEAYVYGFTRLDQFRGESAFSTWMTRIAINAARMHRRKQHLSEGYDTVNEHYQTSFEPLRASRDTEPEEAAAQSELAQLLQRVIEALPEPFRLVFVLKEVHGLDVAEIAASLDVNAVTVKTRLFRARVRLRQTLHQEARGSLTRLYPFDGARCAGMAERVITQLRLQHTAVRSR